MTKVYTILLVLCLTAVPTLAPADVDVEYIGHASFVIRSPDGVRVVVDPFNSNRWLGYRYPDSVEADVVLVTHPHYDHDASYYWGDSVPVFREPGRFRIRDVELLGVEGRHADPYGKEFGQKNTIWLVEAGGVRIAHLGDNGPLTEKNVRELGRVDVLMLPADGQDHILEGQEVAAIREALDEPLVVPMHYRLEGFLGLPLSLGPLGPWLEKQSGVEQLGTNRTRLSATKRAGREVLVFQPSPDLVGWSKELAEAWEMLDTARQIMANHPTQLSQAGALVERAAETYDGIVFAFHWARALGGTDGPKAIDVLETALAAASRDDWEYRMRAHSLLAELYEKQGRLDEAREHHAIVLQQSYRNDLLEKARAFLNR